MPSGTFDEYIGTHINNGKLAEFLKLLVDMTPNLVREFPHRLNQKALRENRFGEATKELDNWTNEYFTQAFISSGLVHTLYSEEIDGPVNGKKGAPFAIAMDPLDGSSNISSNNPFGTIIGVYKNKLPAKGRDMVCALYKLYGPITTLVIATDTGVAEFVKSRKGGDNYIVLNEDISLPEKATVFGVGGTLTEFEPWFYKYVKYLAKERELKLRYCGALVGDFSQVLHYGGFFGYPSTVNKQGGKLRLYLECATMAYIMEKAGGRSSDGKQSILDIVGKTPYDRTPFFIGNTELIDELEKRFSESI
ncbi:fructose-bisphosphatase class I [Candidatus Micrarchaeota archaeon CG08_land_8_20_14_0_20_49_17]|nr:MAG: hypothetical protein AUJ13_00590 [Candidatus Micrarchaeota archaeon CG1_02_49_24]PIU09527.1 MAG: fructose-bisphosphatase class I [Candidatus Micrarchaeota archaeon CG08_land_8_20_14_0_20_49_17]PIU81333.1 MAG: fructose-bisphosphatase class I [Candidatus Micrarchaeota archaeon CG06_land_8_20_14_3_00_50_6]HII53281.1 fructose-1,6-bisphosphatase [Candidatus Micrarchaeota archaeon]